MRRAALWLGFFLASLSCQAKPLDVTTDRAARVYYYSQADPEPKWEQGLPDIRHRLEVPFGSHQVGAVDERDWFVLWSAEMSVAANEGAIHLKLRPEARWVRITPLLILLPLGTLWLLKRRKEKAMDVALLESEPLIRSDGQIPRRSLNGYRLVSKLGAGAMGVVYLGENDRGERCAIKVPMPSLASDPDFVQRFTRELKLGLHLKHPRVVRLLALPTGKEPYIVLEYIDGIGLDKVPREALSKELERCWNWCDQILDALDYVHSQGVIHRDLKPANLMVLENMEIKLMDFGVAHESNATRLTETGSVLGTPLFMAPEQIQGDPCDPRIDLYALGVILYERLSGKPPFPEEFLVMMRMKLAGELPGLATVDSAVPPPWAAFVESLMARDPDRRPRSAAAAREQLRTLRQ